MPTVSWLPAAQAELAHELAYLGERSTAAADRLADAVDRCCALLEQFPEMGRTRDDLGAGLRTRAIERYLLIYRLAGNSVEVLHFLAAARDIAAILRNDPSD